MLAIATLDEILRGYLERRDVLEVLKLAAGGWSMTLPEVERLVPQISAAVLRVGIGESVTVSGT